MPCILWNSPEPATKPSDTQRQFGDLKSLEQTPTARVGLAFLLGAATAISVGRIHRRYLKRFPNGDWLTPDVLNGKRWLKGVVTNVGDADNFRLYHTPGFGWRWPFKFRRIPSTAKDLKDQTVHIRIAGIDAPEASHFGRPAQAYASESLVWLKTKVEGKTVYCQPIRRDQYSRIVSVVLLSHPRLPAPTQLSLEMLRAGWATIYEQSNAEYGAAGKEEYLRTEEEAKKSKRGMWKLGRKLETPAEYKKRHASGEGATATTTANSKAQKTNESPSKERRVWWFW